MDDMKGDSVGPQPSGDAGDWRSRVMSPPSPTTPVGTESMIGKKSMIGGKKSAKKMDSPAKEMAEGEY